MNEKREAEFEGYGILELMGHRQLGGWIREATLAGGAFLRIDVPKPDSAAWQVNAPPPKEETLLTAFYPPHSIYALTPVSGATAHIVAVKNTYAPVSRWDVEDAGYRVLPPAKNATTPATADEQEDSPT